jgi:hypothetical protein
MVYDWDKDGGHDYLGQCELMLQSQPLGLNIEHIMNLTGMTIYILHLATNRYRVLTYIIFFTLIKHVK